MVTVPVESAGTSISFHPPMKVYIHRWYISNANPVELGMAGERYIVSGYLWLPEEGRYEELRVRTGN
jgi:hypothetical protein